MIKQYSELAFGIDLIVEVYQTYNPIIIAEKLEEDLDICLTIHQIIDYFEINNYNIEEYEESYMSMLSFDKAIYGS